MPPSLLNTREHSDSPFPVTEQQEPSQNQTWRLAMGPTFAVVLLMAKYNHPQSLMLGRCCSQQN